MNPKCIECEDECDDPDDGLCCICQDLDYDCLCYSCSIRRSESLTEYAMLQYEGDRDSGRDLSRWNLI